jgi:hypothetical protein
MRSTQSLLMGLLSFRSVTKFPSHKIPKLQSSQLQNFPVTKFSMGTNFPSYKLPNHNVLRLQNSQVTKFLITKPPSIKIPKGYEIPNGYRIPNFILLRICYTI